MCTLIVINRVHKNYPVVIAANRDEYYSRKSIAPACINKEPLIWGGQDEIAGGTWLGVTKVGFFVGITNQRTNRTPKENVLSRGQVVLRALKSNSLDAVCDQLSRLNPASLNPFNLIFGTAEQLKVAYCHSEMSSVEIHTVPEGIQVLPNGRLNDEAFPKVQRCQDQLTIDRMSPWPEIKAQCVRMLSNHEKASLKNLRAQEQGWRKPRLLLRELDALCVHAGVYGTCSSTILALKKGGVRHYCFASGPPCKASFHELSALNDAH
ncbi:MAG: NRDE family protein [Planctomycetota bacterium]|nr:NRDE family protein [Planctomycetota bacterium]